MNRDSVNYSKPSVRELFTHRKYFIPKYQRPFAWKKDNAEKFWEDIFEGDNMENDYFLGSILLNKKNDGDYEVIDGQQRLTTCSLFFFAIYLVYKENVSSDGADRYIFPYLSFGDRKEEYNTLTLSRNNNDFYKKILSSKTISNIPSFPSSDTSNSNLFKILNFFIQKLKENQCENSDNEKNRLDKILDIFEKQVFFLQIEVSDYSDASKLFEVLNDRGTALSDADLLRNFILSELERKSFYSDDQQQKWNNIEENVGLDDLEQFLRYSSFIFIDVNKEKNLFNRVKKFSDSSSPKIVLDELLKLSEHYAKILNPELADDKESELLSELSILGGTQARSILLSGYRNFSNVDILELLNFLVSFTLRYSILGGNPNKLEKEYANLAFQINQNNLGLDFIKSKLLPYINNDDIFEKSFLYHEFKTTKIPRYILTKIENSISNLGEKITNSEMVHLEHIMPKNISKWGENDSYYYDVHSKYINTIGNMVILSNKLNTSIKNNLFNIKKSSYKTSKIDLVEFVEQKEVWKEEEILGNANRYMEYFNIIWKI